MLILGIDEAGRGPVIGPMVMTGCIIDSKQESYYKKIGVKDSKKILPNTRKKLYKELILKDYHTIKLSASDIDYCLLETSINLNKLELLTTVDIIVTLRKKIIFDKVIIDCPIKNTNKYKSDLIQELEEHIKIDFDIISENKADDKYISVGCASIIAKVTRDKVIEELNDKFGDFGSGYPSDPRTKEFLKEKVKKNDTNFLKDVRKSWKTYTNLINENKYRQKKLF